MTVHGTIVTVAGCALAALALTPAAAAAGAAAGELDPSFDGDGKRFLPQPQRANEVLVQQDGKILVVGNGRQADDFLVRRLNPDGSLDRGFDGDGTAVVDFGAEEAANAAALQPDGRILVAGNSQPEQSGPRLAVARLRSDGGLDATFDPGGPDGDGKKVFPFSPGRDQSDAAAVLVQPDGRIVLVGDGGNDQGEMAVTRLTPAGKLDGTVWEPVRLDGQANTEAAALTPDGKVVAAEVHFPPGSPAQIALARFRSDGRLDRTLGADGEVTLASEGDERVEAVLVQPDGRILVAGASMAPGVLMAAVTRFHPDGTPDESWDTDARAFADFGGVSVALAAALQPDGKVLAAGTVVDATLTTAEIAVARFRPDGSLDPSFATAGRATVDLGLPAAAAAVALQPDGRAILAGFLDNNITVAGAPVARLLADPPPAPGGGPGGAPTGSPGGAAGDGVADRTAPLLTRLRLIPRRFPRGNRPPLLQTRRTTRQSAQIRFTLSEPARVRFTVRRARRGRFRSVAGRFAIAAPVGPGRVRFDGRLTARRRLAPGRYRLIATPIDRAGNTGRTRRTTFRLLAAQARTQAHHIKSEDS
jgi:uncharacterized delta-60 repeat protein